MTDKPNFVDAFRDWEKTHNRDNYGRYDAFKAGADFRLKEVCEWLQSHEGEELRKYSYPTITFNALVYFIKEKFQVKDE